MKDLGKLIRSERNRLGMSQQQLANQLPGISRTTISKYETHNNGIPLENLLKIVDVMDSPRLKLAVMGCAVRSEFLDLVDNHPLASQMKLIEELQEALESINRLDLINKLQEGDLNEDGIEALKNNLEQVYDAVICGNMYVANMAEKYNINLKELEEREVRKMKMRGYLSAS